VARRPYADGVASEEGTEGEALGLDLDGAMSSVMSECWRDEVPDVIRHKDFPFLWKDIREQLSDDLEKGRYQPRSAGVVEVPKGSLVSRPIAVMGLVDRVVYQAVMERIGPLVDAELTEEVRSARLYKKKSGKYAQPLQTEAWAKFQRAGRELCDAYEHVCMVTTDITSYFEFIDTTLLVREIREIPGMPAGPVNILARLLDGISKMSDLNGVPQGPEVSSVLGNFYLRPLDAILRKLDVKFLRFQDDIKVFAGEPHVLRRAVHTLTPVVRGRHLNLSTAKTKLLMGDEVKNHFEDSHKDAINYGLSIGAAEAPEELRALFDGAVAGEIRERDVKFAVNRLAKLKDPHAVSWILENLSEVPYLASILVRYLGQHFSARPEIEVGVRQFLLDPMRNIDPYVELQLIRMLSGAQKIEGESYTLLWQTLIDPAKDSRVRQFAARAFGRHLHDGHHEDLALLRGLITKDASADLRRALLVGLYEAGAAPKSYLAEIALGFPELSAVCSYLRGNPTLPDP
jgi:hypothetical protein